MVKFQADRTTEAGALLLDMHFAGRCPGQRILELEARVAELERETNEVKGRLGDEMDLVTVITKERDGALARVAELEAKTDLVVVSGNYGLIAPEEKEIAARLAIGPGLGLDIHQALGLADEDGDLLAGVSKLVARVAELESKLSSASGGRYDYRMRFEESDRRLKDALSRVAELEAAAAELEAKCCELESASLRPLPFSHPDLEPGTRALVVFRGCCPMGGDRPVDWCVDHDDLAVGWLPWPG